MFRHMDSRCEFPTAQSCATTPRRSRRENAIIRDGTGNWQQHRKVQPMTKQPDFPCFYPPVKKMRREKFKVDMDTMVHWRDCQCNPTQSHGSRLVSEDELLGGKCCAQQKEGAAHHDDRGLRADLGHLRKRCAHAQSG